MIFSFDLLKSKQDKESEEGNTNNNNKDKAFDENIFCKDEMNFFNSCKYFYK